MPLRKKPTEYLRQLYFDTIVFTAEALRHLVAETGVGQVVMGTDYPYPWTTTSVDHILGTPGLSDADKEAILGGNLMKFRVPVLEVFFTLICGASAVSILEALR